MKSDKQEALLTLLARGQLRAQADGTVLGSRGKSIGTLGTRGYLRSHAWLIPPGAGQVRFSFGLHQVVWLAHHGRIPDGMQINHIDGNKLNNRPENLELVTPSGNQLHAIGLGLVHHHRGEQHHQAKLSDTQVAEIRARIALGQRGIQTQLAREYGVAVQHINKIAHGLTRRK